MIKRALVATAALVIYACADGRDDDVHYVPRSEIGKILLSSCPEVARMYNDTSFLVTLGVEETDLHFQTMEGTIQEVYIIKVDTKVKGVSLRVALPDNSNDISGGWKRQTITKMAERMTAPGARVVAMINGDFGNLQAPGNPRGPVHRRGVVVSPEWDYDPNMPQQGLSFVGVTNEGKMVIEESAYYERMKDALVECMGAGVILLKDGVLSGSKYIKFNVRDPRMAIGYTDDGVTYLLAVDGRKKLGAAGATYKEMAYIFKTLGCVGAVNLDGGGSAQMLIRHPIANIFQIRNTPSDGAERPVWSGWAVVVEEP